MGRAPESIVVKAVGDICLTGVTTDPFSHVANELAADLLLGNLECALTRRTRGVDKNVVFNADPALADHLAAYRFNPLCLANNHVLDYRAEGLRDTLETLERRELQYVGAGRTAADAQRPLFVEINDATVALLATADAAGGSKDGPTISSLSARSLLPRIGEARGRADLVIVLYHGGIELDTAPSPFVVRALRSFVDAGADIVFAHHPHVLQAVETYRRGVIAYSLGNFVFDNRRYGEQQELASRSIILEVQVEFRPHAGSTRPELSYHCHPVVVQDDGLPRRATPAEASAFHAHMLELGERLAEVRAGAPDVRRLDGMASQIHKKSPGTILRYGVRHIGDFSPREITLGIGLLIRHGLRRLIRRKSRTDGQRE